MAGGGCVKKFRNCEAAAAIAAYQIQMDAFHQVDADPGVEVSEKRYLEMAKLDEELAAQIRRAAERVLNIGLSIAADQGD